MTESVKTYSKIPNNEEIEILDDVDDQVSINQKNNYWCLCLSRMQINCIIKLILVISIILTIIYTISNFNIINIVNIELEWINNHTIPGFFAFTLIYIISSILLLPGSIASLVSGFIFGMYFGTLVVWIGACISALISFLIGRYLLRDWIAKKANRYRIWNAIDFAVEKEGFKIVSLLRLSPIIHFGISNYALGITSVKLWDFFLATSICIIPGSLFYVYLGSVSLSLKDIMSGSVAPDKLTTIIAFVTSGVFIVLIMTLTTYYAKKALNEKLNLEDFEHEDNLNVNEENHESVISFDSKCHI